MKDERQVQLLKTLSFDYFDGKACDYLLVRSLCAALKCHRKEDSSIAIRTDVLLR